MARSSDHQVIAVSLGTMLKALAIIGLVAAVYYFQDLVIAILVSVVIASAVEPATRFFARYRVGRLPAVLIVYLITFGILFALVPFFIFPILSDLVQLSATLPQRLGTASLFGAEGPLRTLAGTDVSLQDLFITLRAGLAGVTDSFFQTASFVFGSLFSFILIVVMSFYLSVQPNGISNFLRLITPLNRERYVLDLWQRSQQKIGYWMQGQLLLGLLMGVLTFLGLTILQVPHALVFAMLAAIFELIPFFGPILAAVPAVLLAFGESAGLGIIVIGLYVILQQFENHLIYPLVVEKMVGVPPLVVILSILVGAKLAGFLGIILAVPVASLIMELAVDVEKRKVAQKANA